MNIEELERYFLEHNLSTYSRDNFDSFINNENLSFTFPSIHITGTNGKGSTANYIYQIYLASGRKVALYNSPYFDSCLEMININGKIVDQNLYLETFNKYKDKFEKYNLSSFEMQTIIAFDIFQQSDLDLAVVEVGMGGFIDATNIITPVLSVISSISLEHTNYLGRSISEIAYNKAGIIKSGVPVLVGKLDDSALYAIRERAKELKSSIIIVEDYNNEKLFENCIIFDYRPYNNLLLKTCSFYQLKNASLAIEAIKILNEKFPISEDSIRKGLTANLLPCRFEFVKPNVILDGAHNSEAMENLVQTIEKTVSKPIHVLFACFKDKNIDLMLNQLGNISNDIVLTTFNHKRARTEIDYFLYLEDYKFCENYDTAIKEFMSAYPDDVILVTGSLAFVGIVRRLLS